MAAFGDSSWSSCRAGCRSNAPRQSFPPSAASQKAPCARASCRRPHRRFLTEVAVPALAGVSPKWSKVSRADRCASASEKRIEARVIGGFAFERAIPSSICCLRSAMSEGPKSVASPPRAIAACATDLLVIGFNGFRQVCMGHPADVGLVDAHAESHVAHDDQAVFGWKRASTMRRSSASIPPW